MKIPSSPAFSLLIGLICLMIGTKPYQIGHCGCYTKRSPGIFSKLFQRTAEEDSQNSDLKKKPNSATKPYKAIRKMGKNKIHSLESFKTSQEALADHPHHPTNSVKEALDKSASTVFRELRDQYSKKNYHPSESSSSPASRKSSSINTDPTIERFLQQSLPKRSSTQHSVDRRPISQDQDDYHSLSNKQQINWNSLKYSAIQEAATAKAKERKEKEKEEAILPPPSAYYYHREEDDSNDLAMLKQLSLKERIEEMTRRGLSPEEMVEKGFRENLTEIIGEGDNKDKATDETGNARRVLKGKFIELSSSEGSEGEAEVLQLRSNENEVEKEEEEQKTDYDHTTTTTNDEDDDGNAFDEGNHSNTEEYEQQRENTGNDSNNDNNDFEDQNNSNSGFGSKVWSFASSLLRKIKSSIFQRGRSERNEPNVDDRENLHNEDAGDGNQVDPPSSYSLYRHMMKEKKTNE
jgi:hypothetical protein